MTSSQISEWEAYDKIDPIGTWRDDFRIAKLEALIQNIVNALYARKGEKPKLVSPIDEMPDWTGDRKVEKNQSVEEMKQILLGIASAQNKKVERLNIKTPPPNKKKR